MVREDKEARKVRGIKLRPTIFRKARVRAASTDKGVGEWVEEAIQEKVAWS